MTKINTEFVEEQNKKVHKREIIYYIGDSHTAGIHTPKELGIDYKHITYPKYLSEMMDMEYVNLGVPGSNLVNNVIIFINNLKDIIDNAKIVFFQFQHFQNAYFRFDEENFDWKDLVVRDDDVIDRLKTFNLTEDDKYVLVSYLNKFEERRSWYEMKKVYTLFDQLKLYGIECYCIYWNPPKIIKILDDERNVVFDNKFKFVDQIGLKKIKEETNGLWDDTHIGTESNIKLAELINNFINKK
jgi:hypothetical protein